MGTLALHGASQEQWLSVIGFREIDIYACIVMYCMDFRFEVNSFFERPACGGVSCEL